MSQTANTHDAHFLLQLAESVLPKNTACQKWDSNPRLQGRLRPERSALDRSAILTYILLFFQGKIAKRMRRWYSTSAIM